MEIDSKAHNIMSFQLSPLTNSSFDDLPQAAIECSEITMMMLERLYVLSEKRFRRHKFSSLLFYTYSLFLLTVFRRPFV